MEISALHNWSRSRILCTEINPTFVMIFYIQFPLQSPSRGREIQWLDIQLITEETPAPNLDVFKSHFNSGMFPGFHEYLLHIRFC